MTPERENYLIEKMREIKEAIPHLASRIILDADFERIEVMYSNRVPMTEQDVQKIKSLSFVKNVRPNLLDCVIDV